MLFSACYTQASKLASWVSGMSLSKPHTSWKNGTSITLTKIYMEIQINSTSIMHSQKFMSKNQVITYKCFRMCVYHTKNYQSSLLMLHIRLACMFITWRITRVVYWHSFQTSQLHSSSNRETKVWQAIPFIPIQLPLKLHGAHINEGPKTPNLFGHAHTQQFKSAC